MQTLTNSPSQQHMPAARVRNIPAWLRAFVWLFIAFSLLASIYFTVIWPWISRWGASTTETNRPLPGDDLVPAPILITTKAIDIQASPEQVWPWLVQLGVDRGGMYSYLWVENMLLRLNVANVDEIRPEWQHLQVGDFIRFTPKDFALNPGPGLYVLALEPNHNLLGCFGLEDEPANCSKSSTWQFILEKQADNGTRLLLRSRTAGIPSPTAIFGGKLGYAFQFYMERKMLLGIKARAEAQTVSYSQQ